MTLIFINLIQNKFKLSLYIFLLIVIAFLSYSLLKTEKNIRTVEEIVMKTPVVINKLENSSENLVFIAHGFAGSSSFMRAIAISLAQTGYTTIRFDFLGHGKHNTPYFSDLSSLEKTTGYFANQTHSIIDYYLKKYNKKSAVIIGHSMASDIVIRVAAERDDIDGVIGISTYSNTLTENKPKNVLIINGELEHKLREKSLSLLQSYGIEKPKENILYGSFLNDNARKIISVDYSDHIRILYSKTTQKEVINWIGQINEKVLEPVTNQQGFYSAMLLFSLFFLFILTVNFFPQENKMVSNIHLPRFFFLLY